MSKMRKHSAGRARGVVRERKRWADKIEAMTGERPTTITRCRAIWRSRRIAHRVSL